VPDLQSGLELAGQLKSDQHVWVIGGGTLYHQAIDIATIIERSVFNLHVDGDTYVPQLDKSWIPTRQDPTVGWRTSHASDAYRFERSERTLAQVSYHDSCPATPTGPCLYWFGRRPPLGAGMCWHGPVFSTDRQNHCGSSFYTGADPTVYRSGLVGI